MRSKEYWVAWNKTPKGIARRLRADAKRKTNLSRIAWKFADNLKRKYGLQPFAYAAILLGQKFLCYSCGKRFGDTKSTKPHVDHEHSTGRIRGLLCNKCNMGMGLMGL